MPTLTVEARGQAPARAKALPIKLTMGPDETVADMKRSIRLHFSRMSFERQRLTDGEKKPLDDETRVSALGGDVTVYLKDLGPQASWRLVYIIEYSGPLFIHPLFYFFPQIYTSILGYAPYEHSLMQKTVYAMCMLHYAKRELESAFVHRFSKGTMPASYIIRNSAHYWILGGLLIAAAIYGPWYSAAALKGTLRDDPRYIYGFSAIWVWAQLSNLSTHITLRNLRPPGTRTRAIPYGYGFDWISCPNYFFEAVGWICVCAITWSGAVALFYVAGTYTMLNWAIKKHKNYKKEFGTQYPKRYVMFPFII